MASYQIDHAVFLATVYKCTLHLNLHLIAWLRNIVDIVNIHRSDLALPNHWIDKALTISAPPARAANRDQLTA